jgi:endonuclease I
MVSLGLMGRRQIPEAREFLEDVVSSADNEIYRLRWYNQNDEAATLSFALTGFVIMKPEDIEGTVARAKSRIEKKYPELSFFQVTVPAMQHEVRLISELEKQPVTDSERRRFLDD